MKKLIACLLVASMALSLSACTSDKEICGKTYTPYGVFSTDEKNPNIHYEISFGNVFWSAVLIETVFVPVYLIGWRIMQPVHRAASNHEPGVAGDDKFGVNCPT